AEGGRSVGCSGPAEPSTRGGQQRCAGAPRTPLSMQTDEALRALLQRFYALQGERGQPETKKSAPVGAPGTALRGVALSVMATVTFFGAFLLPLFPRGHRAYLSSAPHYDFPRYRQLVHEVTTAFSGISREVLQLQGRLRGELGRPDLAQHLTRLQEREQEKLQLVSAGHGGVSIRSCRLIKTIEAISEILQDLKYDSEEAE
uniref:Uncharacterized protein n=1 Tax=Pavo cristatus TaxID=9049 RepID=A0A8C9FWG9_PAVCR